MEGWYKGNKKKGNGISFNRGSIPAKKKKEKYG